jgi:enamine deaminase RidA (YjgF/YER057c/UK114 family)
MYLLYNNERLRDTCDKEGVMERKNISSGTKWETIVGYSRAVRVGNIIHVAGTTASDENGQLMGDDIYTQTRYIIQKIEKALKETGADLTHVVRTRLYVTDVLLWEDVARAHREFFVDVRPVCTIVQVSALIGTGYLIEIEVEAILDT